MCLNDDIEKRLNIDRQDVGKLAIAEPTNV